MSEESFTFFLIRSMYENNFSIKHLIALCTVYENLYQVLTEIYGVAHKWHGNKKLKYL